MDATDFSDLSVVVVVRRSDQPDFLELGLHDLLVEWLHNVFVGAGMQSARDMRHVIFRGAKHHFRAIPPGSRRSERRKS